MQNLSSKQIALTDNMQLNFDDDYSRYWYRRSGNFRVAFFRVRNVRAVNFRRVAFFRVRNVRAFNFRRLSNWRKIFNSENFPIYGS